MPSFVINRGEWSQRTTWLTNRSLAVCIEAHILPITPQFCGLGSAVTHMDLFADTCQESCSTVAGCHMHGI